MTGTHAPSTPLNVGDSVREICAVCNRSGGSCAFCVDGYVYRGVYDEQRSGEMRPDLPPGHCSHAPKCIAVDPPDERDPFGCCNCGTRANEMWLAGRQRIAELARAVEDPTNSEPLRQLLAAIKEAAR